MQETYRHQEYVSFELAFDNVFLLAVRFNACFVGYRLALMSCDRQRLLISRLFPAKFPREGPVQERGCSKEKSCFGLRTAVAF